MWNHVQLCKKWNEIKMSRNMTKFCWLCWGLTSQSTIFQSYRDGAIASWVINQYFRGVKCLAQGHNTAAVGLEPRTSRSGVRHSTTEPPRSPHDKTNKISVRPAKTLISLGICPVWSVFIVRMKKAWILSYPLSAQRRLWSDWADAQADLSLRWAHSHFVGFVMSRLRYVYFLH